ncbi:MAG TPA: SRPBCC domain-containing protein [Acetobacteraceae bacterium]|jgi:carbon monoxide dehydrogenase subunit G
MHFEGEFSVPGTPDQVIRRFADVERMAHCMPGAAIEGRDEQGNYLGAMLVAFGPKKIRFRGRVSVETDLAAHTGSLHGRGAADMRAARIGVRIAYALRDDPASVGSTLVKLTSDAELGGVLADFARTGGVPFAKALMQDFSQRVAAEFATEAPRQEPSAPPVPLAMHRLLWQVIKARLAQFARWLGWARA